MNARTSSFQEGGLMGWTRVFIRLEGDEEDCREMLEAIIAEPRLQVEPDHRRAYDCRRCYDGGKPCAKRRQGKPRSWSKLL